jgi:hypothetical protein
MSSRRQKNRPAKKQAADYSLATLVGQVLDILVSGELSYKLDNHRSVFSHIYSSLANSLPLPLLRLLSVNKY